MQPLRTTDRNPSNPGAGARARHTFPKPAPAPAAIEDEAEWSWFDPGHAMYVETILTSPEAARDLSRADGWAKREVAPGQTLAVRASYRLGS